MRDFFRSPLFRCLVCLILVCCILVNVSPIRTEALSAGAAITAIIGTTSAVAAVASIFQCLGVMPDSSDTSVFEGVVNDCVDALTASGVLVNGMLSVLQLSDGVVVKNHVNQGIIEAIHDWLFANDVVTETAISVPSGYWLYNGQQFRPLPEYDTSLFPYCAIVYVSTALTYYLIVSSQPLGVSSISSSTGRTNVINTTDVEISYLYDALKATDDAWSLSEVKSLAIGEEYISKNARWVWSNYDVMKSDGSVCVSYATKPVTASYSEMAVAAGLVAGQIGTDIETDYKTWVDDGVIAVDFGIGYVDDPNTHEDDDNEDDEETGGEIATIPPDEIVDPNNPVQPTTQPSPWWQDNRWLNIGGGIVGWELGQLIRQLLTQNQTQTQTAVGDPQYMVDTSLFGNGGNGNNTIAPPDTGDPDSSTPTDPSVPNVPSDIAAWTFDLKDFFPFCIPFDLYDFFSVLDATPEAPQFHWELQDLSGRVYPIDIDLSAWDDLASFFRKLQLFLFITGLAAASRKFIKW